MTVLATVRGSILYHHSILYPWRMGLGNQA